MLRSVELKESSVVSPHPQPHPHYWSKTFLSNISNSLWIRRFSSLPVGDRHHCRFFVNAMNYVLCFFNPLAWFIPWLPVVSPHVCNKQSSTEYSRVTHCGLSEALFLCSFLFSGFLSWKNLLLRASWALSCVCSTQWALQALPPLSCTCATARKLSWVNELW